MEWNNPFHVSSTTVLGNTTTLILPFILCSLYSNLFIHESPCTRSSTSSLHLPYSPPVCASQQQYQYVLEKPVSLVWACMCVFVCVWECMCVCVCLCVYKWDKADEWSSNQFPSDRLNTAPNNCLQIGKVALVKGRKETQKQKLFAFLNLASK